MTIKPHVFSIPLGVSVVTPMDLLVNQANVTWNVAATVEKYAEVHGQIMSSSSEVLILTSFEI